MAEQRARPAPRRTHSDLRGTPGRGTSLGESPLAQWLPTSTSRLTAGVLSGPRTSFAVLSSLVRGQYQRRRGFTVNVLEAITVLERSSPEEANWWRVNAPHLMKLSHFFLFPQDLCTIVE